MPLTRIQVQNKLLDIYSEKQYLTQKEITDHCKENSLDLFETDKVLQFLIDKKVFITEDDDYQIDTSNEEEDDDIYDASQIDFNAFYLQVIEEYPQLEKLILEIKKTLPPQRKEWQTLIQQVRNNNQPARERMIYMYLRSVLRLSYLFSKSYDSDFEESFQNGTIGLIKAIDSYDITSPQPFPGYYTYYVMAALQRSYERRNNPFDLPTHRNQELLNFLAPYKKLIERNGIENLLDYITEKKRSELKEKQPWLYSYLESKVDFNFNELVFNDVIEENGIYQIFVQQCMEVLKTIPPREKDILLIRFGLIGDYNTHTLEEVASIYSITRERVRQIELKALRRLRHPKRSDGFRGYSDIIDFVSLFDCYINNGYEYPVNKEEVKKYADINEFSQNEL